MLENPKINHNLIYDYRGVKTKAPFNTSGWNSVYVAGKIIEKIGPILAIKNQEFIDQNVVKNLIKNLPQDKRNISISGLSTNSNDVKKIIYFLPLKVIKIMVKIILKKRF